jgi:hypothetical protein
MTPLKEIIKKISLEEGFKEEFHKGRSEDIQAKISNINISDNIQEKVKENLRINFQALIKAKSESSQQNKFPLQLNKAGHGDFIKLAKDVPEFNIVNLAVLSEENFNIVLAEAKTFCANKKSEDDLNNLRNKDFLDLSNLKILPPDAFIDQLNREYEEQARREQEERARAKQAKQKIEIESPKPRRSQSQLSPRDGSESQLLIDGSESSPSSPRSKSPSSSPLSESQAQRPPLSKIKSPSQLSDVEVVIEREDSLQSIKFLTPRRRAQSESSLQRSGGQAPLLRESSPPTLINTNTNKEQQSDNMEPNINTDNNQTNNNNGGWPNFNEWIAYFWEVLTGEKAAIARTTYKDETKKDMTAQNKEDLIEQVKKDNLTQKQAKNIGKILENKYFISDGSKLPPLELNLASDDDPLDIDSSQYIEDEDDDDNKKIEELLKQKPEAYTVSVSFEKGLEGKPNERMVVTVKKGDEIISFFNFDASSCQTSIVQGLGEGIINNEGVFNANNKSAIEAAFSEMFQTGNPDKEPRLLHKKLQEEGLTFVWNNVQTEEKSYCFGELDIKAKIEEQKAVFKNFTEQREMLINFKELTVNESRTKLDLINQRINEEDGKKVKRKEFIDKIKIQQQDLNKSCGILEKDKKEYAQKLEEALTGQLKHIENIDKVIADLRTKWQGYEDKKRNQLAAAAEKLEEDAKRMIEFYGTNELDRIETEAFFTVDGIEKKVPIEKAKEYKKETLKTMLAADAINPGRNLSSHSSRSLHSYSQDNLSFY